MIVDHQGKFLYLANDGAQSDSNQRGKFGKRLLHRSDYGQIDELPEEQVDQRPFWLRVLSAVHS